MSDARRHAVVTTPDLSHKAPTLDLPSPFVPERIATASLTLSGGADDNEKFLPFAFGLCETEGSIRYAVQYGNYLWIVRALALGEREATIYGGEQAGECDGLVGIYSDTGPFASADFSYTWVSGSLTQTVHATLAGVIAALGGTWAETLVIVDKTGKHRAISHSIECWSNVATRWASGIPKIKYRFRGSRVLNTTTGLVQYTVNPWWQARFWALDPSGGRMRPSRINEPSFQAAAAASPSTQYESHMLLSASARECRKMFGLLGDGWLVFAGGNQLTAIADRNTAPVASYDDSHFAADQEIEAGPVADPDQMVNSVIIEYTDTTDPSGIWKTKPLPLRTAGLIAGTETETPVTYKFPQLHDPAIVNLKLGYLLYSYQAYRIKGKWLANAGGPRLMGDVVTQAIPARGISDNFRIMFRDKAPNGTYPVELELIDARRWAGASAIAPVKVGSTLSDPYATPPTPPPVTLVQEGFNVRVTLGTLTPPYDWYGGQIITVQQSGFAERELGRPASGDLLIEGVTMGATYTVRSRVVSVVFPLLVSFASAAPITPALATPPQVVNLTVFGNSAATARAYWDQPATVVENQYGSAFWSASNAGSFTSGRVNDGLTALAALDWTPPADTTVEYDAGPGNVKDFRYLIEVADAGFTHIAGSGSVIEYSDDHVLWSFPPDGGASPTRIAAVQVAGGYTGSGALFPRPAQVTGKDVTKRAWGASGGHRWWRTRKGNSIAGSGSTYELQWGEVTATNTDITHYQINDNLAGRLYATVEADAIPTSTTPLLLSTITTTSTTPANNFTTVSFSLTVIACIGTDHSAGVTGNPGSFTFGAQAIAVLTLANGLNSNIDITNFVTSVNGHSLCDVTGPTAAFSAGGFAPVYPNKTLTLVNRVGQTLTIVDEDASSTAANRITTQTGGNVTVVSPGVVTFVYDGVATRWQLISATNMAPIGVGRTPTGTALLDVQQSGTSPSVVVREIGSGGFSKRAGIGIGMNDALTAGWVLARSSTGANDDLYLYDLSGGGFRAIFNQSGLILNGTLVTGGGTPTIAFVVNGFGTGATIVPDAGSRDTAGTVTITAGTGAGSTGSARVTFSAPLGTNTPTVSVEMIDGTGAWDNRVTKKLINTTPTTAKFEVFFDNNGVPFANGFTYKFSYQVIGKP